MNPGNQLLEDSQQKALYFSQNATKNMTKNMHEKLFGSDKQIHYSNTRRNCFRNILTIFGGNRQDSDNISLQKLCIFVKTMPENLLLKYQNYYVLGEAYIEKFSQKLNELQKQIHLFFVALIHRQLVQRIALKKENLQTLYSPPDSLSDDIFNIPFHAQDSNDLFDSTPI